MARVVPVGKLNTSQAGCRATVELVPALRPVRHLNLYDGLNPDNPPSVEELVLLPDEGAALILRPVA